MGLACGAGTLIFTMALREGSQGAVETHQVGLVAWSLVALGLLLGFLPRTSISPQAWLLLVALGVLTALSAVALIWTSSAEKTAEEVARVSGYAGIVVLGAVAVDRVSRRHVAMALTVVGIVVCAWAVLARLFPLEAGESATTLAEGRQAFPLGYWNALAVWSAMAAVMALAWSAEGRSSAVRSLGLAATPVACFCLYLTYSRTGFVALAVGVALVVLLNRRRTRAMAHTGIGLAATGFVVVVTRLHPEIASGTGESGGLAVFAALAVAALAAGTFARSTRRSRWARGERRPGTIKPRIAVAIIVSLCALGTLGPAALSEIGETEPVAARSETDPAARLLGLEGNRALYYEVALDALAEKPLAGLGPGTFAFEWAREGSADEAVRDAHSFYLEQGAELGVPGLIASMLVIAASLWLALSPMVRGECDESGLAMLAPVAVLAVGVTTDWMWESTAVTALALACAVTAGATGPPRASPRRRWGPGQGRARNDETADDQSSKAGRRSRWTWLAAGVALAAVVAQVPGLVSFERLRASTTSLDAGFSDLAVEQADDAVRAAPWMASPFGQRARAQLAEKKPYAARTDAQAAIEREPLEFEWRLILADVSRRLDDAQAAANARGAAARLNPRRLPPDQPAN